MPSTRADATDGAAWFAAGGWLAQGVQEYATDPAALERGGWWAVLAEFEGPLRMWRFADVRQAELPVPTDPWAGPAPGLWRTSMSCAHYTASVTRIRGLIREGEVYQANLCRVLSAPIPAAADPWALAGVLAGGNPAPYAAVIDMPGQATRVVSASPELFLSRDGDLIESGPIKGTGVTSSELGAKDRAENVMIVDLVRNDLQRACRPGTVTVPALLEVQAHPGLVHLVSTVSARLRDDVGWPELLAATLPPGSVSGAPKSSALQVIADLEPVPRGPYCGAVGWVDVDARRACLAVAIRTFWWSPGRLNFGTGAGITWGSHPAAEWEETQLKARRLLGLASSGPVASATPRDRSPVPAGVPREGPR